MLALAIVLVASASCEVVVSLDHFDDGQQGLSKDGGGAHDAAADDRWGSFGDGVADADDAADAAGNAGEASGSVPDANGGGPIDGAADCPSQRGPTPVEIDTSRGSYCIDSTEVSNAEYGRFLSSIVPANAAHPPGCAGQNTLTPHANWPYPPGRDQYPVVSVDWCQASAYCGWAGKRLCGRIGGGALATGQPEGDALQAQWFNACSHGKTRAYPYGANFDPTACTAPPGMPTVIQPVGTQFGCIGGYPGIYDMTGNVWEWLDVCDTTSPNSLCRVMGGAFDSNQFELSCSFTGRAAPRTGTGASNIGIRCCSDL